IFYKDHLSLVSRPELTSLDECIVCEIKSGSNCCFLSLLSYCSPSQSSDQFDIFKHNWEETVININHCSPTVYILIVDFNARDSDWWTDDATDNVGRDIGDLATQHNLSQVIDKPTHFLPNSTTCIDLIFTSAENSILDSSALPSLFPRCHYQVVFAKFNFKISFPPAFKRKIWDFSRADTRLIREAIDNFDWDRAFEGVELNQQVSILNESILNIFSNFVPNKIITVRNKDALWMTGEVKRLILEKAKIYRRFVKRDRRQEDLELLREITFRCKNAVKDAKNAYFFRLSESLNDPNMDSKRYWSILSKFLHKRKIPKIPPVRDTNNVLISDVKKKANIFNTFLASQCSLINTNSVLPPGSFVTDTRLDSITLDEAKIISHIRCLNVNKAHGWDDISIRMIKICDFSLVKPLMNIFRYSLASNKFPDCWKKANVVPVFKKGDKTIIKNYRPVSLLPVFGKIFEKCIFDSIYNYMESNSLFSACQSGFRKGDSCISQLLSITHDIFKGFDVSPSLDTRGIFLDISKAFDRVWHSGLIFKLKSHGISGPLLFLLEDFFRGRFQRVVLNGQSSDWMEISAGVPQGSILGPLFFLIYINDLPEGLVSRAKIFADDTSVLSCLKSDQ
ncbi:MAG: reverse transcriptase family protein, partial [Cyanobacteria bacterium J06649_11]